jgi:hypothetical protein
MSEFDREGGSRAPRTDAPPFIHALYAEVVDMLAATHDKSAREAIATLYAWTLQNYAAFHSGSEGRTP